MKNAEKTRIAPISGRIGIIRTTLADAGRTVIVRCPWECATYPTGSRRIPEGHIVTIANWETPTNAVTNNPTNPSTPVWPRRITVLKTIWMPEKRIVKFWPPGVCIGMKRVINWRREQLLRCRAYGNLRYAICDVRFGLTVTKRPWLMPLNDPS